MLLMLAVALGCYVKSSIQTNYSQVDMLWSIVPVVYTWYLAACSGGHPRALLMAFLIGAWGVRLTYNFYRKVAAPPLAVIHVALGNHWLRLIVGNYYSACCRHSEDRFHANETCLEAFCVDAIWVENLVCTGRVQR